MRASFRANATLLVALWLGSAAAASAQIGVSFNRTGSGARAAGMANAFIAISDDGTAASWNPSGLAQLRKPELSFVGTTTGDSATITGFRTRDDLASFSTAESTFRATAIDFASLAVPATLFGKPVTFQGAWRRLYSLDYREIASLVRVPTAPGGAPPSRFDVNGDVLGSVDIVSAAAAVRLTPRLALGASYNFWSGGWDETRVLNETPLDPPSVTRFESFTQSSHLKGDSFALGMMLTYPRWSVGVVYQNPLVSDFDSTLDALSSEVPGGDSKRIDGTLRFPRAWGIGGAWRPAARWTVALDFAWDDWTDAIIDTPQTGRISLLDGQPVGFSSARDTWSVNAGAERLFTGDGFVVPLRFGVAFEPQGARDPFTRDPVEFVMFALGTGYNTNSLKFDAAFQYRWASFTTGADFGSVDINPLDPPEVGERRNSQWRLKLSLILRLTDTDKLKRTLHKVFG